MRIPLLLTCLFAASFIPAKALTVPMEPVHVEYLKNVKDNMKNLTSVGADYMALLNRIGAAQNLSHQKDVLHLCTPGCKKIVNGALWFEGAAHFISQLLSTGEKVGFWSIEPLDIIPGKDNRTVVVRFLVHTEKAGIWNTLVILRCNDDLLITEINEIFNSYEGTR